MGKLCAPTGPYALVQRRGTMHQDDNTATWATAGRRARPALLIAAGALLCILYTTLFPFDFAFLVTATGTLPPPVFDWRPFQPDNLRDVIRNLILFVPFGFGVGAYLGLSGRRRKAATGLVFALGAVLSAAIELLQLGLPYRVAGLSDILANSTGALVGQLFYLAAGQSILTRVERLVHEIKPRLTVRRLAVALALYSAVMGLFLFWLQSAMNLSNWDAQYPLAVGNETDGSRPWQGVLYDFQVYDWAMDPSAAACLLPDACSGSPVHKAPVVTCSQQHDLSDIACTSNLPQLTWRRSGGNDSEAWQQTDGPASALSQRLAETGEWTLALTAASTLPWQEGPARIATISDGPNLRNLTVGQQGNSLVLRVRTPASGENGSLPELIVPGVWLDDKPHQIVATFDKNGLTVYVDDVSNAFTYRLAPQIAFFRFLLPVDNWEMGPVPADTWGLYLVFYGMIFTPIAVLLVMMEKAGPQAPRPKKRYFAAIVILLPAALEVTLAATESRALHVGDLVASTATLAGLVWLLRRFVPPDSRPSH